MIDCPAVNPGHFILGRSRSVEKMADLERFYIHSRSVKQKVILNNGEI